MFGKTLGNGYAITACIGREEIMEAGQSTFMSSTFWTERIGPTAALKTLEVMQKEKSWEKITKTGKIIGKKWEKLSQKHNIPVVIGGLPALINFVFPVKNWLKYKTLITQEMLKKGYLASNATYVSTAHEPKIVDDYLQALDPVFNLVKECEEGMDIDKLLEGSVAHSGFKRLN